jgi:hypothetical protein
MTQDELLDYAIEMHDEAYRTLKDKGAEYAQDANAFANFEWSALEAGITREQAWVVFFIKHVAAVCRAARGHELTSETLRGRLIDIMNYAVFLGAMHDDDQLGRPELPTPPLPPSDITSVTFDPWTGHVLNYTKEPS